MRELIRKAVIVFCWFVAVQNGVVAIKTFPSLGWLINFGVGALLIWQLSTYPWLRWNWKREVNKCR